MAGKRLLDIAALFNASWGVAQKHIALRGRQLDVYNRTATLPKALRNQTDRITETAKAASILASRLNESAPAWTSEAADEESTAQSEDGETIPMEDAAEGQASSCERDGGVEQDYFYESSSMNSALDHKPSEDLEIRQKKADQYPLPDGTIPPVGSDMSVPVADHEVTLGRSKDEPLKDSLDQGGLKPTSSGASTIPTPLSRPLASNTARRMQRQYEEQIPSRTADASGVVKKDPLEEGHDKDSFYRTSGHTSPALSSLPRVKIPKHPSNTQKDGSKALNSDTFYDNVECQKVEQIPSLEAVPGQDQISEGINTDLFYSPRIAKMLSGKNHGAREKDLTLEGVKNTPVEKTDLAKGKDQDSFNVLTSFQEIPAKPDIASGRAAVTVPKSMDAIEDTEKLAGDLAEDGEKQSTKV